MSLPQIKPYNGSQRKLIISLDIGTTFSGVSYVFLRPHETPVIHGVTQFPGQAVGGDSKIPSVVCYDRCGNLVAVGSETDVETNHELLEVEDLIRAEWFKLHLRPAHLVAEQGFNDEQIPRLPGNKTAIDIFSDLLRYMYESTTQYIRQRQGRDMLASVGNNIEFVLSHPNGWEGKQQSEMRHAAINAGLVNANEALERISFVTEGEASLHFCLSKIPDIFKKYANDGILVADCGGGTVDISSYARSKSMTLGSKFKEIAPAECLLQGSVFVTHRAQNFLTEKLRGSPFGTKRDIEVMTRYFDKITKPGFRGPSRSYFIPFGRNENDPEHDIRSGSIKLNGVDIAKFFEPAIEKIIKAIEEQTSKATTNIRAIFMVGGFATSDYLFSKLEDHFGPKGIDILRPDAYLNKAVAEGAIIFTIDPFVSSRVSKYTYGTDYSVTFNPSRPDHLARAHTSYQTSSGEIWVPGVFEAILRKDTKVEEEKEFRASYIFYLSSSAFNSLSLRTWSDKIICYRSRNDNAPIWIDVDPAHFVNLCKVTADMTKVKNSIKPQYSPHGSKYYALEFDIVLLLGLTELKAQIAWIENGVEKRGPVSIVYDPDSVS
ncbi:hypothetical protein F5887DRAFT_1259717 [Amanita rubescens]|nr:hypothetical protein F5887DRAFT_1259717 [Amanita rubescens]